MIGIHYQWKGSQKKPLSPKETPKEKEKNLLCAWLSFSLGCMKVLFIPKLVIIFNLV
jgi:hypothetical protein